LDMPAYLQEIEQLCLAKLTRETEVYGLKIMKFAGLNVNMPEDSGGNQQVRRNVCPWRELHPVPVR
ncbi:MAG: hypothetical protein MJ014_07390, partial [Methanocorpusculum sp.]|nr:hypothetical protein [Methanocorpusculum sp.]